MIFQGYGVFNAAGPSVHRDSSRSTYEAISSKTTPRRFPAASSISETSSTTLRSMVLVCAVPKSGTTPDDTGPSWNPAHKKARTKSERIGFDAGPRKEPADGP